MRALSFKLEKIGGDFLPLWGVYLNENKTSVSLSPELMTDMKAFHGDKAIVSLCNSVLEELEPYKPTKEELNTWKETIYSTFQR